MIANNQDLSSQGINERQYRKESLMMTRKCFQSCFRLVTSARMADACAALLVGDPGFHTEGAGAASAGSAFISPTLRMTKSRELALSVRPSASWLQIPNTSACCTGRGTATVGTCFVRARLGGGDW